jgi:hypothetical protein
MLLEPAARTPVMAGGSELGFHALWILDYLPCRKGSTTASAGGRGTVGVCSKESITSLRYRFHPSLLWLNVGSTLRSMRRRRKVSFSGSRSARMRPSC